METRRWWKESVVYQIYPRSFYDSNNDGIGDICGIINKLDYLDDLGVDVIWVSPVYPSPNYDNGYDVSDYEEIAEIFGTMSDLEQLIEEVHGRNMKIVIDLVINHTSFQHPWFIESKQMDSGKRDYYIWREGREDAVPNNWGALFGGSAWTKEGDQYYLHLFSPQQPDLNWENPSLRSEIYSMMKRWLDKGIDGFRMDVISLIAKPDDFSDGEVGKSGYYDPRRRIASNPRVHEYIKEMRQEVFQNKDIVTIGEASATGLEDARRFTNPDESELNMVFQFEHMDLDGGETFKWTDRTIPLTELKKTLTKWQEGLESTGWNALFFNNHDQPRMISRMGDTEKYHERSAKMLGTSLHMLKGTPFIYQGEEIGMTNFEFTSISQLRDNEGINAYEQYTRNEMITKEDMLHYISLKSRDSARTPMQWNAGTYAGFSEHQPWMDINQNYRMINAWDQISRRDSIYSYYKDLISLRHKYDVIVYGTYLPYEIEDENVFAYMRKLENQTLFVCCNFSNQTVAFSRPYMGNVETLLSNVCGSEYLDKGILKPYEANVYFINENL